MAVVIEQRAGLVWISFPFNRETVERVKATVPGRKFDPVTKSWYAPVSSLSAVFAAFPHAQYQGQEMRAARRGYVGIQSGQRMKDAPQPDGIAKPELRPYQKAGVYVLSRLDKAILGDDMGLGKTIQGIAWAHGRREEGKGTLCVVPASVLINWQREIERARPGDRVEVLNKPHIENIGGLFGTPDWVVVSWSRIWRENVASALAKCKFHSVIFDEAHRAKNLTTNQSKAALELAGRIPGCLPMTGTPVENRPREAFPMLVMAGLFTRKDEWRFLQRYCDAQKDFYGKWNFDGASNVSELHQLLKSVMVRRTKAEVLKELPPIQYSYHLVDKLENSEDYNKREQDYIKKLNRGKVGDFSDIMALMRVCALGKVKATAERLEECLYEGYKAVVYCSYLDPLYELKKRFKSSVILTGQTVGTERQAIIDEFTNNKYVRLCFTTLTEGVNLQAASVMYFQNLPWTPAKKRQIEGRVHRMGQESSVQVVNVLAQNSIDERLVRIQREKEWIVNAVVDGAHEEQTEKGILRALRDSYRKES